MTGRLRGFAAMSKEKRTAIAKKGGSSVNPVLRSFYKNRELAAEAGRKGGQTGKGNAKARTRKEGA